jgi:Ca2+-binding RTX toxin-like protein
MALTPLTNTVNVQPSGSTAGAVVGFTLDGGAPLTSQSASFVTDDEKVIAGDLHGINQGSQNFGVGGYTEQDLTVHSAPVTVNEANFDTPGLGITTQMLAISDHAQFISATVPNAFIASGSGNDTLAGMSGTNILDGGSGQNTYYGGSGQNFFLADAHSAPASEFIGNMKSGDNAVVYGTFSKIMEDVTPSGVDFQLLGSTGQLQAEVVLQGFTSPAGLQVGIDAGGPQENFFFVHMS